ncbi:MAG: hypothetical protein HY868_25985 [Chloroflexi bacterium]|nr:hypothetical protein [Chloroflexota bacterium]
MPKPKTPAKKTNPRKPVARQLVSAKKSAPARKPAPTKAPYTDEYIEYLERYELYGEGRPRLSPGEFERLDEEMLELLELEAEGRLDDEQIVRMHELEYLMLDSE